MQGADEVGNDFIVGVEVDARAHISDVTADAGEILAERD